MADAATPKTAGDAAAAGARKVADGLQNLVTGLGTTRDKRTYGSYLPPVPLTQVDLESRYRTSWLAGKIIDIPVEDMTREWVDISWDGSDTQEEQLAAIWRAEKVFKFRDVIRDGIRWGRLHGGAITIICIKGDDFSKPLDITKIKKGQLQALRTLDRWYVTPGPIEQDDLGSPNFNLPQFYRISSSAQSPIIHWTRAIRWPGRKVPQLAWANNGYWDDPELLGVDDAVKNYDAAMANSGVLIEDSNVDIIRASNLVQALAADGGEAAVQARYANGAIMKGVMRIWLLDKDTEEYQQKTVSFAGLHDMLTRFMVDVSGACDIPATRLFGQAPVGLSATGESDIRNYYDRLAGDQESHLRTPFETLYEVLVRSTLGNLPANFEIEFNPLWQMSDVEKAARDKSRADMDVELIAAKVITPWLAARELKQRGTYLAMDDDDVDEAEEVTLQMQTAAELGANAAGESGAPGTTPASPGDPSNSGPEAFGTPPDPSTAPESAFGLPGKSPAAHEVTYKKQMGKEAGDARMGDTYRHDGVGWHVYRDGKLIGGPYKTMAKARRRLKFEGR